jgi:long-chain fatty acid transport protein
MKTKMDRRKNAHKKHYIDSRQWARVAKSLGWVAVTGSVLPLDATAEGFRNPPSGTFNLGRAGGRIAHIDDSSAVQQNPANLVDLTRPEANLTPSVVHMHAEHESPSGQRAETTDPWKILPNFFAAMPLADGKFGLGIGLTTPYGISNEWETDGSFANPTGLRYQAPYYSELKTINFNPSAAMKLGENVRLGLGVDIIWSQVTFKQFFPWFLVVGDPSVPDGHAQAQGDGFGFGANAGITWQFAEKHRVAATVRSPVDVNHEGHFRISNVPAPLGGGVSRTEFETEIDFPTIVALGYGIELTDTIRVEADVEWIQFSRFDSLNLDTGGNPFLPNISVNEDWDDTFTAGIAGDWRFHENWTLRAGYQFYQSPVPDETISPTIPDADQHVFTLGLQWRHGRHALEAAYGLDFYDDREISNNQNPLFNGRYDITVHLFSAAYRFTF